MVPTGTSSCSPAYPQFHSPTLCKACHGMCRLSSSLNVTNLNSYRLSIKIEETGELFPMPPSNFLMDWTPHNPLYILNLAFKCLLPMICNQHNLPALRHRLAIERLNAQELVQYITGYGIVLPIATNAAATDLARKEVLKDIIGCIVY